MFSMQWAEGRKGFHVLHGLDYGKEHGNKANERYFSNVIKMHLRVKK
jgi:hypothetical protein